MQEIGRKLAELDADQTEDQTDRAERKSGRIAEQQKYNQRHKHNWRHIFDEERCHSMPPARYSRSALLDCFDNVLDLGFERVDLCCVRVRNKVAHDRDTFDQLG